MIGHRLGPYDILSPLGAGGMGEVYLGRDTRLERQVAVKVLPGEWTTDPDRLRRFEQEAKNLATLNHPNILTVFDVGQHEGRPYLVSELLEGRTLREVLGGPTPVPLPARHAIDYALQIARGLAAAHGQRVIHRDLKPENVFVTQDGRVKILDFGLAKREEPRSRPADPVPGSSSLGGSDTPTRVEATEPGRVLGTPNYMAPEQVQGEATDARTDIFGLGCLVHEMLTGRPPFRRDTAVTTMAAILTDEPPGLASALPDLSPPLARLVRRCLEKSPERRFQSASDLAFALETLADPSPAVHAGMEGESGVPRSVPAGERFAWMAAVVAFGLLAAILAVVAARSRRPAAPAPSQEEVASRVAVVRSSLRLPTNAPLAFGDWNTGFESPLVAISPDGREVTYVARAGDTTRLYRRALDRWEAQVVPETEGAIHAFYSPDGTGLGFLTDDKVKKVSLRDNSVQTLCNARSPVRAFWTRDDRIHVLVDEGLALATVLAIGGTLETNLVTGWLWTVCQVLPDGRAALVTSATNGIRADFADIAVLDLRTREARPLHLKGYDARYVASGHLVFARDAALHAVAFDTNRLEVLGRPVAIATGVTVNSLFRLSQSALSDNGTLVYVPGGDLTLGRLARVDRHGGSEFLENVSERIYGVLDLSADDRRVAVHVGDVDDYVWVYDLETRQGRRVTFTPMSGWPRWKPPGSREIAFDSLEAGRYRIFLQAVDGDEPPTLLLESPVLAPVGGVAWAPDGGLLAADDSSVEPAGIALLRPVPGARAEPLASLGWGASFSPDGRWVAFGSARTGRYEVWVVSVADKSLRQVSSDGGMEPIWLPNGDLFWRWRNRWFSTRVTTQPELRWTEPTLAFTTDFIDTAGVSYDVSSDGQHLFVVKHTRQPVIDEIRVIQNCFGNLPE